MYLSLFIFQFFMALALNLSFPAVKIKKKQQLTHPSLVESAKTTAVTFILTDCTSICSAIASHGHA